MSIRRLGALVALALTMAACTAGPGTGGQLDGTHWVLSSYDSSGTLTVVPETLFADAQFDGSQLSGFSGCNTYRALFAAGGRTIRITQASSTLMACDEASMSFEQRFLQLLDESRFYSVHRDQLTVYNGGGGGPSLVFDAAPRNPLLGKWIVGGFTTGGGSVTAVLPNTELNVEFGIASVGGSAGCNSFNGTYGTNGDTVRISRLATTQIACEQPVMDQEKAFLDALSGAAKIVLRGQQVNLTDRQGHLQVALIRPAAVPSESPGPSVSAAPSESPSASAPPSASPSPSASPTPTPTPSPTPTPTPTPTPAPTATPTTAPTTPASPTTAPSPSLPPSFPPSASCKLIPPSGGTVATIVYPGSWFTVAEPATLACRYFDPAPITVPADPSTLVTAVRADVAAKAYTEVVTAATDPATWKVAAKSEVNVRGTPVTCVAATAAVDTNGITAGTQRSACFADVKTAGTVSIWAVGPTGDPSFASRSAVVGLMTAASTFTAPG